MEGDWDQWMADDPEDVEDFFLGESDPVTFDEAELDDEYDPEFIEEWFGEEDEPDSRPAGATIEPGKRPERSPPLWSPFVYHLTSIANFEGIVASAALGVGEGVSVGDLERSAIRGSMNVFTSKRRWVQIRSLVGFYFTPRTPMTWNVVRQPFVHTPPVEELLILRAELEPLARGHEFVFTDGHSQSPSTRSYSDLAHLGAVDFDLMSQPNWARETDQRHRQAEFLVAAPVSLKAIDAICAADEDAAAIVRNMTAGSVRVVSKPSSFFIPR